jgi:alkylated DNA repair dioxygenase AlkB
MKVETPLKIMTNLAPGSFDCNKLIISGLRCIPDFISEFDEAELIRTIDNQPWITDLKRRVQHYGYRYNYKARNIHEETALGPLPAWLSAYSHELHAQQIFPTIPDQVIINEYTPGQGISAHIDCVPCFTETIASLSLGSPCIMEFTHDESGRNIPVWLEPRSLIVLSGDARYHWRHAIPARKSDTVAGNIIPRGRRLSLTFRKVILAT